MQVLGEQHVNKEAERINLDLTKQLLMAQMQGKGIVVVTDQEKLPKTTWIYMRIYIDKYLIILDYFLEGRLEHSCAAGKAIS